MTFGPSSVFAGKETETEESISRMASSSNMFLLEPLVRLKMEMLLRNVRFVPSVLKIWLLIAISASY